MNWLVWPTPFLGEQQVTEQIWGYGVFRADHASSWICKHSASVFVPVYCTEWICWDIFLVHSLAAIVTLFSLGSAFPRILRI